MRRFLAGLATGLIVGAAAGIAVWAWSPWEDNGSDTEAVAAEAREADLAAAEMEGSCPGNATCEISVVGRAQPRIWLLKYDYQPNDSTVAAGHTCLLLRLDDYRLEFSKNLLPDGVSAVNCDAVQTTAP